MTPSSNRARLGVQVMWLGIFPEKISPKFHCVKNSQDSSEIRRSAAKSKEKIRINALKILQFDSRDDAIVQTFLQVALAFVSGLQLNFGLTSADILLALQSAHCAADEYYTIRHAMAWDTMFVIPAEVIAADTRLFNDCENDFSRMFRYKQDKLASNRLSVARIIDLFRRDGQKIPGVDHADVQILLEFATNGITPPVTDSFRPEKLTWRLFATDILSYSIQSISCYTSCIRMAL
jgi:hypothetical protein